MISCADSSLNIWNSNLRPLRGYKVETTQYLYYTTPSTQVAKSLLWLKSGHVPCPLSRWLTSKFWPACHVSHPWPNWTKWYSIPNPGHGLPQGSAVHHAFENHKVLKKFTRELMCRQVIGSPICQLIFINCWINLDSHGMLWLMDIVAHVEEIVLLHGRNKSQKMASTRTNWRTMMAVTYHVTYHHGCCWLLKCYTVGFAASAGYKHQ